MAIDWTPVRKEHLLRACQLYDEGKDRPSHPAQNTFLLVNQRRYPAKYIRGLGYQVATSQRLNPSTDYSGGWETVRYFNRLGFDIEYNGTLYLGEQTLKKENFNRGDRQKRPEPITAGRIQKDPQKDALRKLLEIQFGKVIREAKFEWLVVPHQGKMDTRLATIARELASYRGHVNFYSPGQSLSVDYFIPSKKLIIEYDERQHFTIPRAVTLRHYPSDLRFGFDKSLWIYTCESIRAVDQSPYDRDETRAFYDSLRDIVATINGFTVIRIKEKDQDWTSPKASGQLTEIITEFAPQITYSVEKQAVSLQSRNEVLNVAIVIPRVWDLHTKAKSPIDPMAGIPLHYKPVIPTAPEFGGEALDLVVFPEAYIRSDDEERRGLLGTLSTDLGANLLVGATESDENGDWDWETLLLFRPGEINKGETLYYKHSTAQAVAFEFEDWNPERDLATFIIKGTDIGCTICHDSYLGLLQHYLVKNKGAKIWINPSYDNVVPQKWETIHRLRAVENGVLSLCTLHDNLGRLDIKGRPRRETIRPFGFMPDGNELLGYPLHQPNYKRPLSMCKEPGIYLLKCPIIPTPVWSNLRLLTETRELPASRLRNGPLVGISLKHGEPHVRSGNRWIPLKPDRVTEVDGIKIIMGMVMDKELFEITSFTKLLKQLHEKGGDCKMFFWNQWSSIPCRPEQLVDVMMGRTLEFLIPVILSDQDSIYEITERANQYKKIRRVSINDVEGEVSLEFTPDGFWDSFKITVSQFRKTDQRSCFEEFLSKYLSLQ